MNDTHQDFLSGSPWGTRPGTEPPSTDSVLLQVSLGIAIILAWLLSLVLTTQAALGLAAQKSAAKAKEQKEAADRYGQALEDLKGTSLGQLAREAADRAREEQWQRLMNAWLQLKHERPLRVGLQTLAGAERVQLDDGRDFLPGDPVYAALLQEAERVFFTAPAAEAVSRAEVAVLLTTTWQRAGFDQDGREASIAAATEEAFAVLAPPDLDLVDEVNFKPTRPTRATLLAVARTIKQCLEEERAALGALQYALVTRIAIARLSSPAATNRGDGPAEPRPALRELIDGLKRPLALLPEVEKSLLASL